MENRSTDHKDRLLSILLLFALGISCGCSAPVISAPKKKLGPTSFEKTWVTLFGSAHDLKNPSESDKSAVLDDDDLSQLIEKSRDSKPTAKEENSKQQSRDDSRKVSRTKAPAPQEETPPDETTAAQMKKLHDIFSQDIWIANLELQTWLEKQAQAGDIPDVNSLVARPNDPNQKTKTNFYAQLNASADSKIRPGNFIHRSAEAAGEGPISLNRWFHGPIEDVLLNMELLEPDDANQLKLLAAKVLAQSPDRSIVETNSAIFLARLNVREAKPFLYESLQSDDLSLNLRAAAAEAFAQLDSTQNDELLRLVAKYSEKTKSPQGITPEDFETEISPVHDNAIQFHPGVPVLFVDLLQSLARRIPPTEAECFTTALQSRSAATRLAAVRIWRDTTPPDDGQTCPEEILKLTSDPGDERIRIAALAVAARWNHPQAMRHILDGVHDMRMTVRLAALDALSIIGGPDAIKSLDEHANDTSPKIRARVAASLRKLNEKEALFRFAADKSPEVRNEVARGLDDPEVYNTTKLVKTLLTDQSSTVQKSVIESIRNWPLELSVAILFEEMKSPSLLKRETATNALAEKWPPAAEFEFSDRRTDIRTESLAKLKDQYYSQTTGVRPLTEESVAYSESETDNEDLTEGYISSDGSFVVTKNRRPVQRPNPIRQVSWSNPSPRAIDRISLDKGREAISRYFDAQATREQRHHAKDQMLSLKGKLTFIVEYLAFNENQWIPEEIYNDILPQIDPVFLSISNLDEENTSIRRKSADEIYGHSQRRPFGPLVVSRLYEAGVGETDLITVITLFKTFESSPGEIADQFAKSFLDNAHPEIRRRACELLGHSENLQVLRELLPMLDDTAPEVVRTTLASLDKLATVYFADNEGNMDLQSRHLVTNPVRRLLLRPEASLQIAASTTLVHWKDTTGHEAFKRLAGSRDDKTRLAVAQSIGNLNDTELTNILVMLLDDKRGSVRQAALNALPQLVGEDHGNPGSAVSIPITERVQRWKYWAQSNIEYKYSDHDKIGYSENESASDFVR